MARHTTPTDLAIRKRWAGWLSRYVGEGRGVKVPALAPLVFPNGRGSWVIYDWLECTKTISPRKTFAVGEALRALGLEWSCGAVALYAADYMAEFVYSLTALMREGSPGDAAVIGLLVEAAVEENLDARQAIAKVKHPTRYERQGVERCEFGRMRVAAAIAGAYELPYKERADRVAREIFETTWEPPLWFDARVQQARTLWQAISWHKKGAPKMAGAVLKDGLRILHSIRKRKRARSRREERE